MIKIQLPFIQINTPSNSLIFEIKEFKDDRTVFYKNKKYISQIYYGHKISLSSLSPSLPMIYLTGSNDDYNSDNIITCTVGNGNNEEPSIILENSDGTYTNRFFYKGYRTIKGGVKVLGPHAREVFETLDIIEYDDVSNIEIHHYYSTFKDSDVIVSKTEIKNLKGLPIYIKKISSLQLPINSRNLDIYSFDGSWLYERSRHETHIESGIYIIDSKVGSSSHKHNPFFEIKDNTNKKYYGFNFIYSGNHKELVEVHPLNHSKVQIGVSDYLFNYKVKSKSSFITPEAIMVVSSSLDDITLKMHDFIHNHIINPKFKGYNRPVIFNNWEGTGMNINEGSLLEMARLASEIGIEQFVMDDGWFKNRIDGTRALGDWEVDKMKFPYGLKKFVSSIRKYNLKFGIWVEPEMISIKSDLYKKHPEFASRIPHRDPIERRNQLCLVFDDIKPDYVKWDFNRYMTDNYSLISSQGEFMHNFIMGSYELIEKLTKKYPSILFESCASGGGRYDLGMLYYMPQTWGSDDTNSYCRCFITCGTLAGYPQSSFGAHVSRDGNPRKDNKGGVSSLEDRFNLNCIGAFGYEFDIRTFDEADLDVMKKQIFYYKEHRQLLQYGDYYTCDNIFDNDKYYSFSSVSKDKGEAIFVIIKTNRSAKDKAWKIKGINPNFLYTITARPQSNFDCKKIINIKMSGKDLIEKGINIKDLFKSKDFNNFDGIVSRMFYLKRTH